MFPCNEIFFKSKNVPTCNADKLKKKIKDSLQTKK